MADILAHHRLHGCLACVLSERLHQFVCLLQRLATDVGIGLAEPIDIEGELADIAYRVDMYLALLAGQHLPLLETDVELGRGEVGAPVAQDIHAGPCSPLGYSPVYVSYAALYDVFSVFIHSLIVVYGQLTTLVEVLVYIDERVYGVLVVLLAAAGVKPVAVVLAQVEAGGQTGGTAVAVGFVVAVEQPILLGLTSHNVEQVASERLAHIPTLHGGLVGLGLGLGEQVGVLEGAGKAVAALLLIGFAVYASLLHGVELAQGGGIDGAQHGRLGALLFGSHLRSHGVERVGRYLDGQPSTGYLCLDQMAVGFLGSGAHDNLVEHGDGSAWLPCGGSLVEALPERGVGVGSRCPHHGDEHQSE